MKTNYNYKPLSIYIHIPFCVRKCFYCDFLSFPADRRQQERYVSCLFQEIKKEAPNYAAYEVQTIFIGGGTPSLLPEKDIEMLLNCIDETYRVSKKAEITIEVNPGAATLQKLAAYRKMGINRLSIGLQSAVEKELLLLGRIHGAEDFFLTYERAVKTGFNNINVDIMSAIPSQTIESYKLTLEKVLFLEPKPAHISAYSLIIEEGTPFYENPPELPDEETDREMYKITNDILKRAGYHRYEISNYARKGYECRHNQVYWQRGDYAGFGIGAASLVDNVRFRNGADIQRYFECFEKGLEGGREAALQDGGAGLGLQGRNSRTGRRLQDGICGRENNLQDVSLETEHQMQTDSVKEDIQKLSKEEQMEEFMFLGLRMTEGVSNRKFRESFGCSFEEIYSNVIKKLEKQGALYCDRNEKGEAERIYLSDYGLDVSNAVMAEFLF